MKDIIVEAIKGFNRTQQKLEEKQMVPINLEHMLCLHTHQEVIDFIMDGVNIEDNYSRMETPMSTILVPNHLKINSKVPMLCVHTDTVPSIPSTLIKEGNKVRATKGGLGADDRAGCYIVKELLTYYDTIGENCPYIIGIFDQEEVGCVGSSEYASSYINTVTDEMISTYIGLDRRGHKEIALYDLDSNLYLTAFDSLINDHGYAFKSGTVTDASNLGSSNNKCVVNFSVGYYNEHTGNEYLMLNEMLDTIYTIKNLPYLAPKLWNTLYVPDEIDDFYYYYDGATDDWSSSNSDLEDMYPWEVEQTLASDGFVKLECECCGSTHDLYSSVNGVIKCVECLIYL